jgi:hypothetical protein
MRLTEFTSADEQLALWKLISDAVWTSINAQRQKQFQQQQQAQQKKQAASPTGKKSFTRAKPKPIKIPTPKPPPPQRKPAPEPTLNNKATPQQAQPPQTAQERWAQRNQLNQQRKPIRPLPPTS